MTIGGRRKLPETVEEAVAVILEGLNDESKELVKSTAEDELIRFHHGWGTGIRNGFGLWTENRRLAESCQVLARCGSHPDDASGVIIKGVWNRLHGLPLEHHQCSTCDTYTCALCGGEAYVERWREDAPVPPEKPLCFKCSYESSPEYLRKQEEIRRHNEAILVASEKGRRLGEAIRAGYAAAVKERHPWSRMKPDSEDSEDKLLLNVARRLYATDPEFRALWDDAKGEPPDASRLPWLRIWKRLESDQ